MRKLLLDLIRGEQCRRTGPEGEMLVVLLRNFTQEIVPHTRVGNALLEMAPDEPFEMFQARAVAAAKASGANFVAINVPDSMPI
jgi:hypothetical protein